MRITLNGKETSTPRIIMSINEKKIFKDKDYVRVYKRISEIRMPDNALPVYEYLYKLKGEISKELYAYLFRGLLQFNTKNVPVDFRLKMFEGVSQEDIMFEDELNAIRNTFCDTITIYRGTDANETVLGLSWTLDKSTACSVPFYKGRAYSAQIPKKDILLYIAHDADEEEIIAHVTSNYRIIKEG